jgi:hypothetical protein
MPSTDPMHAEAWAILIGEFTNWLDQKKAVVARLDAQSKAPGTPVYLGWGDA